MGELLNCRWCNGEPERVGVWPWGHTVRCKTCIASGPHKQTSEEADKAWNTRSGSQGVVTEEMVERACKAMYYIEQERDDADGWAWPYFGMSAERSAKAKAFYQKKVRAALLAAMGGKDHRIWTKEDQRWDDYVRACYKDDDAPPPTTISEERP